jgi:hypothetical protein
MQNIKPDNTHTRENGKVSREVINKFVQNEKYSTLYDMRISCVRDKPLTSDVWTKWTDVFSMQIHTVILWVMKLG